MYLCDECKLALDPDGLSLACKAWTCERCGRTRYQAKNITLVIPRDTNRHLALDRAGKKHILGRFMEDGRCTLADCILHYPERKET